MKRRFLPLALAGAWLLALGLFGCGHHAEQPDTSGAPVVRIEKPVVDKVTDYERFTGQTAAPKSVEIRARVTGYLMKTPFKEGSEVKKGELLFEIDRRPYQATVDNYDAQVTLNRAKSKLASADYERARVLSRTPGAVSRQELDTYRAQQNTAEASLVSAKANLRSANLDLEFTRVTSPIYGEVGRALITIGNLVNKDQTLLTTVVSVDPMYAYFDVDERTMLRVQKMMREGKIKSSRDTDDYRVDLGLANEGDEYPHTGIINFVNNQVDPSTGTIQIRGTFKNPRPKNGGPRLLTPGMFVRVRVPIGEAHKALLVKQAAIGTDQSRKYLLVVNEENVVEYRPVTVGSQQPGGMQVVEPVKIVRSKDGLRLARRGEKGEDSITRKDSVVVSGLQRIRPGMKVTPKPASEP
jgi:multidrug efflux system membrane fusion protein